MSNVRDWLTWIKFMLRIVTVIREDIGRGTLKTNYFRQGSRVKLNFINLQMQLSTFPTSLLVLLSLITWQVCCKEGEQQKLGPIFHLCGGSFRSMWDRCCGHRCRVHALKRTLGKKCGDTTLISVLVQFWRSLLAWFSDSTGLVGQGAWTLTWAVASSKSTRPRPRSSGSLGSRRPIKAQQDYANMARKILFRWNKFWNNFRKIRALKHSTSRNIILYLYRAFVAFFVPPLWPKLFRYVYEAPTLFIIAVVTCHLWHHIANVNSCS